MSQSKGLLAVVLLGLITASCSSETFLTRQSETNSEQGAPGPVGPQGEKGARGDRGLPGARGTAGANCFDDIGDVNEDGELSAEDCLEAIRRELGTTPNTLQCETLDTAEHTDGVHRLSCSEGMTLVGSNCYGMDRPAYPVVPSTGDDPPNTARCRCSSQCAHTRLMIRCCSLRQ
jgi:hypothetical protein